MAWGELPILESGAISDNNNGRWTTATGTFGLFRTGSGRSGLANNGAWTATSGVTLGQVLIGGYSSLWAGAAFFNLYNAGGTSDLIRLNLDNSPDPGCPQARLQILANGALQVILSVNGVTTFTSPTFSLSNRPMINGVWYFIEIGVTITGGNTITCDVYVNDVHLLVAFSHTFTPGASTTAWNRVWFLSPGGSSALSDLYINNSGFYGDGYVLALRPNGAGNYTQWTSSGLNPNWQNVSEFPPSSAAYNSSALVNDKDTYTLTDLPVGYTSIRAVQSDLWAEKDNTGPAGLKALWRSGGVDSLGTQEFFPQSGAYEYFREGAELSPFTGLPWTLTELNAIEFGQERTT